MNNMADRVNNGGLPGDVDGLAERVGQVSMDSDDSQPMSEDADLPSILIITNIHESVFNDPSMKARFEAVFREYEENVSILFLKNFRRARVEYSTPAMAARARIELHEADVCGQPIKCFFAQPRDPGEDSSSPHLQLPAPVKQFLISPPASPPVGWEPVPEAEPVINYDLLSAITNLAPGESHEIHPPTIGQPGIVVHICEDPEGFTNRPRIVQTRRPEST